MTRFALLTFMLLPGLCLAAPEPQGALQRAAELIERQMFREARGWLETPLIDPRLSPAQRSTAYYMRGFSFMEQGFVVSARKDFNRALEFNDNNPAALLALGSLHSRGVGTPQNRVLAFQLFRRAAALGLPQADLFVGRAKLFGQGTAFDVVGAREHLLSAAEAGYASAMTLLGASYRAPYADPAEPAQASDWYARAADEGDQDAAVALAYMLRNGELGDPDGKGACDAFERAARRGSGSAHAGLAHCYLPRGEREEDPEQALTHFRRAAEQASVDGYLGLGFLYEAGLGVARQLDTALDWFRRAANAGRAEGQYRAARLLLVRGAEGDEGEAIEWLEQAVASGDAKAANAYAWILATSSSEAVRQPDRALSFAAYAVSQQRSASRLDTLAAAQASGGLWEEAVATQKEALRLMHRPDAAMQARLESYLRSEPWRE